jgi:GntR family transcriptional regulator
MSPEPTPPEINLDLSSPVPPFEQIRARVAALVDAGTLAPGTRLPSVRALAADLGIAVGTVARAYRELEGAGYVESRRRHGTTVAGSPPAPPAPSRSELDEAADRFIARATAAGLGPEEIMASLRRRLGG